MLQKVVFHKASVPLSQLPLPSHESYKRPTTHPIMPHLVPLSSPNQLLCLLHPSHPA
ncbi:hypothetical protein GBA52_024642 [Prunus armeniaca]|nr:hypothetical protein GBA52_024642 [Prunus armeniaca]